MKIDRWKCTFKVIHNTNSLVGSSKRLFIQSKGLRDFGILVLIKFYTDNSN